MFNITYFFTTPEGLRETYLSSYYEVEVTFKAQYEEIFGDNPEMMAKMDEMFDQFFLEDSLRIGAYIWQWLEFPTDEDYEECNDFFEFLPTVEELFDEEL